MSFLITSGNENSQTQNKLSNAFIKAQVAWHCTILRHSTHIPTLFVLFKDNGSPAGER